MKTEASLFPIMVIWGREEIPDSISFKVACARTDDNCPPEFQLQIDLSQTTNLAAIAAHLKQAADELPKLHEAYLSRRNEREVEIKHTVNEMLKCLQNGEEAMTRDDIRSVISQVKSRLEQDWLDIPF